MKKLISFLFCLGLSGFLYADPGDVTVIQTISPKNNAFQAVVRSTNVFVSTIPFTNNLGPNDSNLQHALQTIDQLSISGGGGTGSITTRYEQDSSLAVNTTTANIVSPLKVTNVAGKAQIAVDGSSVTLAGVLVAGSNITLTPGAGQTTIASTGGGGGGGTPGGLDTDIQLNQGGVFQGTATLTMNTTSNLLTIGATTQFNNVSSTTWTNVSSVIFSTSTSLTIPSGQTLTNSSSVTVQGVITAGTNITLTPTAGILTISASGGGGGGSSSLAVSQNGVQISSPTGTLNFLGPPFTVTFVGGTTAQVVLNPSSATLLGQNPPAASIAAGALGLSVIASSFPPTGVTPGSCTNCNLTVTAQGLITAQANGAAGGGGGGVNSGTIGQMAYYAVNGTTVSGTSNLVNNTSSITTNVTINALFGEKLSSETITTLSPGIMYIVSGSSNVTTSGPPGSSFQLDFTSGSVLGADATLAFSPTTKQLSAASIAVGTGTLPGFLGLYELQANGTNYAGWVASSSFPITYSIQMPTTTPVANQVMLLSAISTTNPYYPAVSTATWYNPPFAGACGANQYETGDVSGTGPSCAQVGAAQISNGSLGAGVIASSLTVSGVTAGSYTNTNLTVSAQGIITAASNGSAGGGGGSSLAVGTGTVSNFTNQVSSPTSVISLLGGQFLDTSNGTTNFIALNGSSVTLQGQNVIFLQNTLQSGSTFYVSSGTVSGTLNAGSFFVNDPLGNGSYDLNRSGSSSNVLYRFGNGSAGTGMFYDGRINMAFSGTTGNSFGNSASGNSFSRPLHISDSFLSDNAAEESLLDLQNATGGYNDAKMFFRNSVLNAGRTFIGIENIATTDYFFISGSTNSGNNYYKYNEVFKINTTTSSSSYGYASFSGNVGIGISTPTTTLQVGGTGLSVVTTSTQSSTINNGLIVGGHIEVSSTTPVLSACGSSPSIVGNDQWGKVTVGGGVIGTCTMTFAVPWVNAPSCNVLSGTAIASLAGTTSTTAFTFTGTSLTSDVVMYQCGSYR